MNDTASLIQKKTTEIENFVPLTTLKTWYDRFMYEHMSKGDELIEVAEMLPFDNPDLVVHIMDLWVAMQEARIAKIRKESNDPYFHALAFGQRGVTLDDFKYILESRPTAYNVHPAFYYFHIIDKDTHDHFIASNKANDGEKDFVALYLDRVEIFVKTEIPTLESFFFSYLKKFFPLSALKRHTYILGGTGSGKSEVIKYLFHELWAGSKHNRSKSLISLEPHGKLSQELLQMHLTADDPERVIYLDAFLRETAKKLCGEDVLGEDYTFVYNPFDLPNKNPNDINYMTQELSSAIFEVVKDEGSHQMTALLRACVSTLLENDGTSIADLKRFTSLIEEENQDLVQMGLKNSNIEHRDLMNKFYKTTLNQTKNSIYFRLQNLIADTHLRRILVGKSTIDLEKEMNAGKVIICNLSKGHMGKESAPMLGKLFVALIQGYALKRQGMTHHKPTFLFMDEMQNYITPSIEQIMTESRKYGLHLVLANQVLGQNMDNKMKRIILSNTALKFCGDNDADSLKGMGESMNGLKLKDFDKLKKYHFYAYNKLNKKMGAVMTKVPPTYVNVKPPHYMTKNPLKSYFLWLANDSGYYIKSSVLQKTQDEKAVSRSLNPRNRKGGDGIYSHDFID